jgi:hypothetical protein
MAVIAVWHSWGKNETHRKDERAQKLSEACPYLGPTFGVKDEERVVLHAVPR